MRNIRISQQELAKTAFVNKCKKDACEPKAVGSDGKPLAGAAKTSFMKKCQNDA
jgi:hypothetical protein